MANKDLKNRIPIGSAVNKTLYEEYIVEEEA